MHSWSFPNNTTVASILSMSLLALQFGMQPHLTRRFASSDCHKSTIVLVQECVKFLLAYSMLALSGKRNEALKGWSMSTWIQVAGIPAALYALQNMAALLAYQNLDALTFNVLNQTKTLSAALNCYLVMRKRQSRMQIVALLLLLLAALVMERIVTVDSVLWILLDSDKQSATSSTTDSSSLSSWRSLLMAGDSDARHWTHGVAPILLASYLSGLAGALSQYNLQHKQRNPMLFSMELCMASVVVILLSLLISPDGQAMSSDGIWKGWTGYTLIPIGTNATGGLLVGLVTKYAGSVRKGFALMFGIFVSGMLQSLLGKGVTTEQIVGGILSAVSLWMHATNPPAKTQTTAHVDRQGDQRKRPKQE